MLLQSCFDRLCQQSQTLDLPLDLQASNVGSLVADLDSLAVLLCLAGQVTKTLLLTSTEVVLVLANLLSGIDPALLECFPASVALLVQGRPVGLVVVVEVQFTTVVLPQLLCGDVLLEVLVELHLLLGDWVDKGRNKLEEGADVPGHCGELVLSRTKAEISTHAEKSERDQVSRGCGFARCSKPV